MDNKSHLTAIKRNKISKPTKLLKLAGLLKGRILDYGCGRGDDCVALGCEGYDPYYRPQKPQGRFDTILCHFVLNVLPTAEERLEVLKGVGRLLRKSGKAYITVRRDKNQLNGWTKKGTYQCLVELDLPIIIRDADFVIYELTNDHLLLEVVFS